MDSCVRPLETQTKEEGRQRKQEYDMTRMEDGFKNEESARQMVQKELAVMKDEI